MNKVEGWAFLALMAGLICIPLSLALLENEGQIAGLVVSVILCILAGGLYGASVRRPGSDA